MVEFKRSTPPSSNIPVIDFSPFDPSHMANNPMSDEDLCAAKKECAKSLDKALTEYGCFYACYEGYSDALKWEAFETMKKFFKEQADESWNGDPKNLGYQGFAKESAGKFYGDRNAPNDPVYKFSISGMGITYEKEDVEKVYYSSYPKDKTSLAFQQCTTKASFPSEEIRRVQSEIYKMGDCMADIILRSLAVAMGLSDEEYFCKLHKCKGIMRTNFYPEINIKQNGKTKRPHTAMRFGAHTDLPTMALLLTDNEEGLEILKPSGEWIPIVASNPRGYFVNLGDTMVRFSNKRWTSAVHRVAWPKDMNSKDEFVVPERISIPLFVNPTPGTVVAPIVSDPEKTPARFEPTTPDDIWEKRMTLLVSEGMVDKDFNSVANENVELNKLGVELLKAQ